MHKNIEKCVNNLRTTFIDTLRLFLVWQRMLDGTAPEKSRLETTPTALGAIGKISSPAKKK